MLVPVFDDDLRDNTLQRQLFDDLPLLTLGIERARFNSRSHNFDSQAQAAGTASALA